MRLKVVVGYNVQRQREQVAEIKLTADQAKAIVMDYFNNMDYEERQSWIAKQRVRVLSSNLI